MDAIQAEMDAMFALQASASSAPPGITSRPSTTPGADDASGPELTRPFLSVGE